MTQSTLSSAAPSAPAALAKTKLHALAAMALGAGIIFIIGFSHIPALHNAAHDTRHSFAYPCH